MDRSESSVNTNNAARDGHPRISDLLNADSSPNMAFVSTAVSNDRLATNLTTNGISKPVEFEIQNHASDTTLSAAISVGIAGPFHAPSSWNFHLDPDGLDPVLGIHKLQEASLNRYPDYPAVAPSPPTTASTPASTQLGSSP